MAKTMKTQKAIVSEVQIGTIAIEGLMLPDGSFAVAVPQIASLLQFLNKNASRDLKALMGEGFQFLKAKSELNPKPVNIVTLPQFSAILLELSLRGNESAIAMSRLLVGLSLHQLFCDAFGVKFEAEDRQQWLIERMESKRLFRELTDAIQQYYAQQGIKPQWYVYSNCMDAINRGLFGMSAKQIREAEGIKSGLTRDNFGVQALGTVTQLQKAAAHKINQGDGKPFEVVKAAVSSGYFLPCSYKD